MISLKNPVSASVLLKQSMLEMDDVDYSNRRASYIGYDSIWLREEA